MGKFIAQKTVERIEWDFSGVPHVKAGKDPDAPEFVEGEYVQHTLAEPDPEQVAAFLNGYEAILETELEQQRASLNKHVADEAGEDTDVEVTSSGDLFADTTARSVDVLADLGAPRSLLEQLPPRHLRALLQHVVRELQGEGEAVSSRR